MSRLIAGMALFLAVSLTGSRAEAGSWCAFYDFSTYNCGLHSYQQCYATIFGNGGWCRPNFFEGGQGRKSGRRTRDSRS